MLGFKRIKLVKFVICNILFKETTRPSALGFESHESYLSVANGILLVHSQEQFVPPVAETTAIYNQTWLKNGVKHQFTSPHFTTIRTSRFYQHSKTKNIVLVV